MSTDSPAQARPGVIYPSSDGMPMAENTLQWLWIVTITAGLDKVFRNNPNVFVASDLLWYPVEDDNKTCVAPGVFVAFGRPKHHRLSYLQFEEGGVAPQVVFEILSPSNRPDAMTRKLAFYERFGVEEYYIYDPDTHALTGFQRQGGSLRPIPQMDGWISPRLGVRFELDGELRLFEPGGERFLTHLEWAEDREAAHRAAEAERRRAEAEAERARAADERARAAAERAERLLARLRALGQEPEE